MSVDKIDLDQSHQYVNDVYEAVEIAKQFQSKEIFDLFRGQIRNFPVLPSLYRPGVDRQPAIERLEKFYNWANNLEELKSLHNDKDAIRAVAQHHGFKTNFLDFTTDPEIAGFFACDTESDSLPPVYSNEEEWSCIICVNRRLFQESWKRENNLFYEKEQRYLLRIIDHRILNHFRLQAQKGVLLETCLDNWLLEAFSGFYRILFPYKDKYNNISKNKIYPEEKSHLEHLIDEYLVGEKFSARLKALDDSQLFQACISVPYNGVPNAFLTGEIPSVHDSWKNSQQAAWQNEPDENFAEIHTDQTFTFAFTAEDDPHQCGKHITQEIFNYLNEDTIIRNKSIKWNFTDEQSSPITTDYYDVEKDEEYSLVCNNLVTLIWDGIRRLPYTNEQIANCISNYICLERFGEKYFDKIIYIELSSRGTRTWAFAEEEYLKKCIRADYMELIADQEKELLQSSSSPSSDMMSAVPFPSQLFEYTQFIDLFARQIIPSQMYYKLDGTTIIYSPVRVDRFGNS